MCEDLTIYVKWEEWVQITYFVPTILFSGDLKTFVVSFEIIVVQFNFYSIFVLLWLLWFGPMTFKRLCLIHRYTNTQFSGTFGNCFAPNKLLLLIHFRCQAKSYTGMNWCRCNEQFFLSRIGMLRWNNAVWLENFQQPIRVICFSRA